MELRYRGTTYQKRNIQVEIVTSELTAKFLGQTYPLRRPIQEIKPKLGFKKYRGIAYGR